MTTTTTTPLGRHLVPDEQHTVVDPEALSVSSWRAQQAGRPRAATPPAAPAKAPGSSTRRTSRRQGGSAVQLDRREVEVWTAEPGVLDDPVVDVTDPVPAADPSLEEVPSPEPASPAGEAVKPADSAPSLPRPSWPASHRPAGTGRSVSGPAALVESSDALTSERLLLAKHTAPADGWRRAVYRASGGRLRPKDSAARLQRHNLEARATVRLGGHTQFVPVLSRKGGVGKTTTAVLLGQTLAGLRSDRVIAIDANPDRGTLAERVDRESATTVRDAVAAAGGVSTFAEMSHLISARSGRLDVLASDTDPLAAEAFDDHHYKVVADLLAHHYALVVTDCGTGMVHPVQRAALTAANGLVLVSGVAVDEARLASETLEWLEAQGFGDLAHAAVVVINHDRGRARTDVDELVTHFAGRCRAVVQMPYDPHLAEGAQISLDQLAAPTRSAALELAAHVIDGVGKTTARA